VVSYAGSARTFTAERITGDRELWNVSVSGVPGDSVFLVENDRPTLTAAQPVLGVTLVPPPPGAPVQLGVIPASGVLTVQARIEGLNAGVHSRLRFVQGVDPAGQSCLRLRSCASSCRAREAPIATPTAATTRSTSCVDWCPTWTVTSLPTRVHSTATTTGGAT
jgi:hypothetical protein